MVKPISLALAAAMLWSLSAPLASAENLTQLDVLVDEGYALDRQGEFASAIEKYKKVLAQRPEHRKARFLLANTYYRDNQMDAARHEMEIVYRMERQDRMGQDAKEWLLGHADDAPGTLVTTFTGGEPGFADGALGSARFNNPSALALTAGGDLLIADTGNHRLRRIGANGKVTTIAGAPAAGYADGPVAKAKLGAPSALAVDTASNIYFADGNRVRFLTHNGLIGTLAGAAEAASRDGDYQTARFDHPTALATDKRGNVYVAEGSTAPAIRKVAPDGTTTLFAGGAKAGTADGNGAEAQFQRITALKMDAEGLLWILDGGRLRMVNKEGGVSTAKAAKQRGYMDGPQELAQFGSLQGFAVDDAGNWFLCDTGNHAIRTLSLNGQVATLTGGVGAGFADGKGINVRFDEPIDVAYQPQGLFVLDRKHHAIRLVLLKR